VPYRFDGEPTRASCSSDLHIPRVIQPTLGATSRARVGRHDLLRLVGEDGERTNASKANYSVALFMEVVRSERAARRLRSVRQIVALCGDCWDLFDLQRGRSHGWRRASHP
jgi:hypothetical protein